MFDNIFDNPTINNAAKLAARVLLAIIFILGGYNKIVGYSGTAAYMASAGVPGILLPLVIITELVGGICILIGYQTRLVALLMAGFTLLTAIFFHGQLGVPAQMTQFLKNLAIAGGFLQIFATGPGIWSVDGQKRS
ncbi:DoxX family protein [Phreatobacter aquaticus]|uniref:DoxX family protein n=1 Tax=Phreatobacter aquaticus TaxID=2570229 RepID=A0A4D7QFZ7_9HYPH|nr:DoxX family protein [Phreatobacter aquaticus]QCK85875.1 DoxX family protein [Phreatobacter aquaticus]